MDTIGIDNFWRILHDPSQRGFSLRYRKTDGTSGEKHNLGKSGKRYENRSTKGKLRYDLIEKGTVLLEDIDRPGKAFTLRNRLLVAVKLVGSETWLRIKHRNF